MNRRTFLSRRVAASVGAVIVAAVALAGCGSLTKPLGPGLDLPTPTDSPAATRTEAATPVAGAAPASTPQVAPEPLCGGPPSMILLGVGADNRDAGYLYGLADAIRIARVDFTVPSVSVLSMPRDLWVEIPEISDHYGITHGKLNQSYFYGSPGMGYYDGPGAGPGLLARTLDLNFGLRADHYGAINMQTFVRLVDAVGGIDIYLDAPVDGRPVDDKTEDMGYFAAGHHRMDGATALRFSRIRKVDTVFARDDRQTMVLCALKEKLLSPASLGRIPELIGAFQDSILTDLSPIQLAQLACLAPQVSPENLRFASVPREMLTQSRSDEGSFIWDVDNGQLRALLAAFAAGEWPTEPDQPSCP